MNFNKLIPGFLNKRLHRVYREEQYVQKLNIDNAIPKKTLDSKHLLHATLLPARVQLLHQMPKNGIVAELGVDKGDFSVAILQIANPGKLHLIDSWDTIRYGEDKALSVRKRFASEIENKTLSIHRGFSTERVSDFPDDYFDWIYIDTDHSYKTTCEELKLYAPKIKNGGIIAGHDFIKGNWLSGLRYGVMEAVYEFCIQENWEIIYLTMEINDNPSFAIRKIEN